MQLNRLPANPQGVFVSRLVLEGLTGPCTLQQRLVQQLAGSPAFNLQGLELRFAQNAPAVTGSGLFWQRLLQQMPLLAELRLCGIGACETGFEVPHIWDSIGQLKGESPSEPIEQTGLGMCMCVCTHSQLGCFFLVLLLCACVYSVLPVLLNLPNHFNIFFLPSPCRSDAAVLQQPCRGWQRCCPCA